MFNISDIESFLVKARLKTYTTGGGKVDSLLIGSNQHQLADNEWLYRDIYFTGKNDFCGIETIYNNVTPVFCMSYYGNWGDMTEEQIDIILRGALVANPETRMNKKVEWQKDGYIYICKPRFTDDISRIQGIETITKDGKQIFEFSYVGGVLD